MMPKCDYRCDSDLDLQENLKAEANRGAYLRRANRLTQHFNKRFFAAWFSRDLRLTVSIGALAPESLEKRQPARVQQSDSAARSGLTPSPSVSAACASS